MLTTRYTRRDWLIALALTLVLLVICLCRLTTGLDGWGDDHSAYISEGIAIADGTFDEQARLNYYLHPSTMPAEADREGLVYVWGYPLLLAAVYRAVGFDRVGYTSIVWYKLPSLIALALLAGVLYLFFRRRFPAWASAALTVVFYAQGVLFDAMNFLYSDVVFLFFAMLTLWLMECFVACSASRARGIACGVLYGAVMWYTREVRLNGTLVCAAALMGHVIAVFPDRKRLDARAIARHLLPYAVMIALTLVSERLWLAPATGNTSDLGRATLPLAFRHLCRLMGNLLLFFDYMGGVNAYALGGALLIAMGVGVLVRGRRENLHLAVLLVGTIVVVSLLPYYQGARYIYNVLPIALMFAAYGVRFIYERLAARVRDDAGRRRLRRAACALAVVVVCASGVRLVVGAVEGYRHRDDRGIEDVYNDQAIDMFHYIMENTPEDAVIAYYKPRALFLNTNRLSFKGTVNGHDASEMDYFLHFKDAAESGRMYEVIQDDVTLVYENELFQLYAPT